MDEITQKVQETNLSATKAPVPRYITINLTKAIGIVATALLTSFIGGAGVALATINSDHFTIVALGNKVAAVENSKVDHGEFEATIRAFQKSIDNNTMAINLISNRIDNYLDR
jgi:hypothetical protein